MVQRVADIMNPKLLYIREGDRLSLAKPKILEFGITAVPVLDVDHRPVGVVSLRDLEHAEPKMSAPALTVRASDAIPDAARALGESGVHHLVVVDDGGVAVGMVSAVDFVRALVGLPAQHPKPFREY